MFENLSVKTKPNSVWFCLIIIFIAFFIKENAVSQQLSIESELIRVIDTENEKDLLMGNIQKAIIDKEERVFIIDNGNRQVHYFGADGKLVRSFGREGRGPGEFTESVGGTLSEDGNIFYVLDSPNSRIVSYDIRNGDHLETISIREAVPTRSNDITVFNDQLLLMGNHYRKDEMLHVINQEGEVGNSFGELIDFSNFIHNSNGKMQLSVVSASTHDGKLLLSLAAPKRMELYDSDFRVVNKFENELLPKPWETHMVMRPDRYEVTFYSMAVNSQIISDGLYLYQWIEVVDPNVPETKMHLELRSLENGNLLGNYDIPNDKTLLNFSRNDDQSAILLLRDRESFKFEIYKLSFQ